MIVDIFLLIAGFVLLIKGADVFVKSSVNIARRLRIPNIVIGLTIVALGTSAPEAVISATAAAKGSSALAIGNAIGSNMFNLLLIVGICAIVKPIVVKFKDISRDFWISAGAAALLFVIAVAGDDYIPRFSSALLFLIFIAYIIILVHQTMKGKDAQPDGERLENGTEPEDGKVIPLPRNILMAVLGCALIVAGGQFTVNGASEIALVLGISQRIIALTVVAVGTSLPELVVSLVACKKGEGDVALGNVIGSSIFNILFVVGLVGIISPLPVDMSIIIDLVILTAGSLVSLLFAYTSKKIIRAEGFLMVLAYFVYMTYVVVSR